MKQVQAPARRLVSRLHEIRVHDCEERVRAAVKHDAVNVAQDLERRRLERRLADALAEGVRLVAVHAPCADIAALELVDDEGGEEARGVLAPAQGIHQVFVG